MHIRKQSTQSEMSAHCPAEKLNGPLICGRHTYGKLHLMHYADLVQLEFQVQYKVHDTQLSTHGVICGQWKWGDPNLEPRNLDTLSKSI